ncbi:DUF4129 domain-containing protein [Nonomuraea mesophila]|uniref:DUF4129 domain-containing protein n=1 Tax=Nonomuraea mesophila TaxID=2530382 RepID=A0A4V2Z8I5_9ACTN|nr:DUF4129 domain-containing protein [Nonomuraea mesophila]TDE40546.1 DUF4129 domain-containing protein [Nonomuraea mesophila]
MSPIDREEAARQAARELLDPAYETESLPDRVYRWVMQFLGDLVDATVGGGAVGSVIASVVIVAIIIGVIVLISWQLRRSSRRNAAAMGTLFGRRTMSAAEHRQSAERLAAEEQWAPALQERLRAIARDLEERALVDGMPGRTAHELAAEAAVPLPDFADELAMAARSFDDVTYGGVPGTREAYARMADLDDRVSQARPVPIASQTAAAPAAGPWTNAGGGS